MNNGIVGWEIQLLAKTSIKVQQTVDKARPYTYDACEAELDALVKYCDVGAIAVASGHVAVLDAENSTGKPAPDLSSVFGIDLWLAGLKFRANNVVAVAKHELESGLSGR